MPTSDVVQRGARVVRRLSRGVRRRLSPAVPATPDPQQVAELKRVRKRLRTARAQVERLTEELSAVRHELSATRHSVRDPDPTIALPAEVSATVERVREERLSYLKAADLEMLARLVVQLEQSGRPGLVIEAGTARGGSAIVMAAAKSPERPMKVYDVFGMIPPPTDKDGDDVHRRYELIRSGGSAGVGGDTYYGYRDDLYGEVTESFARCGVEVGAHSVELVRGLFSDTIDLDEPVGLAHLDGDWYESTMTCLQRIAPLIIPGGRIVLDDYYAWSGCKTAVDEYFADRPEFRLEQRAKLHVVRL